MTYVLLNSAFLGLASMASVIAAIIASRRGLKVTRRVLGALSLTLMVMLITTAVFDNLIIGSGLVAYDPLTLSGIFIGIAPAEDFAYTIAAVMLLPAVWTVLDSKPTRKHHEGGAS